MWLFLFAGIYSIVISNISLEWLVSTINSTFWNYLFKKQFSLKSQYLFFVIFLSSLHLSTASPFIKNLPLHAFFWFPCQAFICFPTSTSLLFYFKSFCTFPFWTLLLFSQLYLDMLAYIQLPFDMYHCMLLQFSMSFLYVFLLYLSLALLLLLLLFSLLFHYF